MHPTPPSERRGAANWKGPADARWLIPGMALLLGGLLLWRFGGPLDRGLFDLLLLDREPGWAAFMRALTMLGGFAILAPLAVLIGAALAFTGRRGAAIWLLLTVISGRCLIDLLKMLADRPRPPLDDRLTEVSSMSFPSAHAGNSLLTLLALLALFPAARRWLPAGAALILAIGWSRIGLGVHWPSDVLAGWGLAILWASAAMRWRPAR